MEFGDIFLIPTNKDRLCVATILSVWLDKPGASLIWGNISVWTRVGSAPRRSAFFQGELGPWGREGRRWLVDLFSNRIANHTLHPMNGLRWC